MNLKRSTALPLVASVGFLSAAFSFAYSDWPDFAGPAGKALPVSQESISVTKNAVRLQKAGDWSQASVLLESQIASANPETKFRLAYQLARGWGVARDLDKALELLLNSAAVDHPLRGNAAYELGKLYRISKGENCQTLAFEWFHKALDWGFVKAHLELAKAYRLGLGTDADFSLADFHYRAAADGGSASGIIGLVQLHLHGTAEITANPLKATQIFLAYQAKLEALASEGNKFAARALGRAYVDESLGLTNHTLARSWFEAAIRLNDPVAIHDLVKLAVENRYDWYSKDELVSLLKQSGEAGYPAAFTLLGRLHLDGKFGLRAKNAAEWFKLGVDSGHPGSMEELARLHWEGKTAGADKSKAIALAQHGARLRHSGSIRLLAEIKKHSQSTKTAHIGN